MNVTIYTTESCPWCKKVKEFFREHKIKFTEKDVGRDGKAAKEMIQKSKQRGVPVIDVGGEIVVGFDEGKLRRILKLH